MAVMVQFSAGKDFILHNMICRSWLEVLVGPIYIIFIAVSRMIHLFGNINGRLVQYCELCFYIEFLMILHDIQTETLRFYFYV